MITQAIHEIARHAAPGGRPHPLAFVDGTLWVGSWDTSRLYAVDPATWSVREHFAGPGQPYGITAFDGALRVVVSEGDEDDRYFYRAVPGRGFDLESKTPCPEMTGSHLFSDGTTLYLNQSTNQRILAMNAAGDVLREIPVPTRTGGFAFGPDGLYMISADEEFEELYLAKVDIAAERPEAERIAALPAEARGLAFDGGRWWTNLRDRNETLAFEIE